MKKRTTGGGGLKNGFGYSAGMGGASSFINLSDAPSSYAGAGGYVVVVNPGATGLIFQAVGVIDDHLVLADPVDPSPGTLTGKVDNETIIVDTMAHTMHVNEALINIPVKSIYDNSAALPVTPTSGDRYIALVTANGWLKDTIYEWNGTSWLSSTPSEGTQVVVVNYPIGATTVCSLCVYSFDSTAAAYQWQFVKTYYFLDPIISQFDNTSGLPVTPSIGDRYIAQATAHGWVDQSVYQYNGSGWDLTVPIIGMILFNISLNDYMTFLGGETGWTTIDNTFPIDSVATSGSLRTLGTGAQQAAAGNDPRFPLTLPAVISIYDNTGAIPAFPTTGDRYIAKVTAHGWTANYIYQFNGLSWDEIIPHNGYYVSITNAPGNLSNIYYVYNGTWISTGGDHRVMSTSSDAPDYLSGKTDNNTIRIDPVSGNLLQATDRPVISIFDNTSALPVSPSLYDRYIAKVTANGWTVNRIYEWTGVLWASTVQYTGMRIYITSLNILYQYNGSSWVSTIGGAATQAAPGNIIVSVSNAIDEAAAFAAGSLIVIRTDLI